MTHTVSRSSVAIELSVDASAAFRLFCAVERIPEWIPHVRVLAVVRRDPFELAEEVKFESTLGDTVRQYTLVYVYDRAGARIAWRTPAEDPYLFRGNAEFESKGPSRCVLRYHIFERQDETSMHGAGTAEARAAYGQQVVESFKRWVEGQAAEE